MKPHLAFLLAAYIIAVPLTRGADEPAGDDVLRLANGDSLHGSVAGWEKAGPLWRSAFSSQPAPFKMPGLDSILFAERPIPENATASKHEVLLANGDLLPGTVASLDAKTLALDTWYAGRLEIPRAMVRSISAAGVIYNGPEGLDGWVNGRSPDDKSWVFDDGALSTMDNATLGRDFKLPARSRIEFDLAAGGNFMVMVRFCFDHIDKPGSGYDFQISGTTVDLVRETPDRPTIRAGQQAMLENPLTKTPADAVMFADTLPMSPPVARRHFDIRIDKDVRKVWLFVDKKLVQEFSGLEDLPKSGGALLFSGGQLQNQGAPLRVSKIKISRWSGGLDPDGGASGDKQPA
ncbi:MAG TPA: hypothetical protein VG733_15190, partial [Chthoniobacteraceae bacterium]|nr:hypothetical protein [Chthoniobacteraceae bacterium]